MSDGFTGGRMTSERRLPPFTIALIAVNVAAFLLDLWIHRHTNFHLEKYAALSLEGLRHGYLWQLVSFQFLHGGWIHLVLNCWMIFVFGPPLEMALGKARVSVLYLSSGVAGGALQVLASLLSHETFGGRYAGVVGASAGVFGLVAAFTSLFPETQMTLLLFLVIPLRMTANRVLMLAAVITVLGVIFGDRLPGPRIAHAAHLGGLIAGLIIVRLFMRRFRYEGDG